MLVARVGTGARAVKPVALTHGVPSAPACTGAPCVTRCARRLNARTAASICGAKAGAVRGPTGRGPPRAPGAPAAMLPVHVPFARDHQGAHAKALNRRRAIYTAAAVLALLYGWRALTYNAPASKGKLSAGATKEDVVLAAADAGASFEPLDKQYSGLQTLVVVAGHAVLRAAAFAGGTDLQDNDAWVLEPHQAKHKEQAESMIKHIRAGIAVARADPAALVLFSGGATRANAGPLTEATSYWLVAARLGLLESQPDVQSVERARHASLAQAQYGDYAARARFDTYLERAGGLDTGDLSWRVLDEGFARDSYENFLFSLCRFREITGKYPERVVIVPSVAISYLF